MLSLRAAGRNRASRAARLQQRQLQVSVAAVPAHNRRPAKGLVLRGRPHSPWTHVIGPQEGRGKGQVHRKTHTHTTRHNSAAPLISDAHGAYNPVRSHLPARFKLLSVVAVSGQC